MIIPICIGLLLGLSIIFDGYLENIFIISTTVIIYTYFIYYNYSYKKIILGLFVSFFIVNIGMLFFLKDDIDIKDIEIGDDQEETLVMLLYDGEDIGYNPGERLNEIYFEQKHKSIFTGIKSLYEYKSYYENLGSSDFKDTTNEIAVELRKKLGENYKVVNSYMYTKPYFETTLQEVMSLGYKNIVICPMFITEGKNFNIFKNRLLDLDLQKHGINLEITDVLYKSSNLANLYKNDILTTSKDNDIDSGVLLIGLEDENNVEQDIIFREKIKYYIEKEKNSQIQIKMPLLENNKDDIVKATEELLEFGIDVLHVVIPTCTIDNMHNKNLVDSILKGIDTSNIRVRYIDPKNKVNILAQEIYTQISLINK